MVCGATELSHIATRIEAAIAHGGFRLVAFSLSVFRQAAGANKSELRRTRKAKGMYSKGRRKGTMRLLVRVPEGVGKVQVAGDFSNWSPIAMRRIKKGLYAVSVDVKERGRFEYKYLVDGQWTKDPDNSMSAMSVFGENSVAQVD